MSDANSLSNTVPAGDFCAWLTEVRASLLSDVGSNVPCGDCVGCCVSSYFIPIRWRDVAARQHIPNKYLVQGPNQPPGDYMMGFLDNGHCPMLRENKCTIYRHRPQTCRDYDCRIFAAAGIDAGGADKRVINKRVHEWRFSYPTAADKTAHDAVLAASEFIRSYKDSFPGGRAPTSPTGIAVLAIKTYGVFLMPGIGKKSAADIAQAIIAASADFDANAS